MEEEANSDEIDKIWKLAVNDSAGQRLKKSTDYMKIVENKKNIMVKKRKHRKSPTQQISKIPKKSMLSRSSNLSGSGGNQIQEVTKHEISGA